ncbi:hypothetical protein DMUE_3237 [Dictyocoela muelleri]|nr:hypothetical protein DMUE_3237 [Dictyocoela muelleri]
MNLELNPCLTLKWMALKLETNNNIIKSVSTIHRIVKCAGFSRKVLTKIPINRNSDQNKNLRFIFGQSIVNISNEKIITLMNPNLIFTRLKIMNIQRRTQKLPYLYQIQKDKMLAFYVQFLLMNLWA